MCVLLFSNLCFFCYQSLIDDRDFLTLETVVGVGTTSNVVVEVIAVSCFKIWLLNSDVILMVRFFDKFVVLEADFVLVP